MTGRSGRTGSWFSEMPAEALYRELLRSLQVDGDAALADALDMLARGLGENRFRHASTILRGAAAGPKSIDDAEALRRIAAFPPAQQREAVGIVAHHMAGPGASRRQVESLARRLRRKRQKNETDRPVMSASPLA